MPEKTIPWWRKALNFALDGIRSGFGLFARTAKPEPAPEPELSDSLEENSEEEALTDPFPKSEIAVATPPSLAEPATESTLEAEADPAVTSAMNEAALADPLLAEAEAQVEPEAETAPHAAVEAEAETIAVPATEPATLVHSALVPEPDFVPAVEQLAAAFEAPAARLEAEPEVAREPAEEPLKTAEQPVVVCDPVPAAVFAAAVEQADFENEPTATPLPELEPAEQTIREEDTAFIADSEPTGEPATEAVSEPVPEPVEEAKAELEFEPEPSPEPEPEEILEEKDADDLVSEPLDEAEPVVEAESMPEPVPSAAVKQGAPVEEPQVESFGEPVPEPEAAPQAVLNQESVLTAFSEPEIEEEPAEALDEKAVSEPEFEPEPAAAPETVNESDPEPLGEAEPVVEAPPMPETVPAPASELADPVDEPLTTPVTESIPAAESESAAQIIPEQEAVLVPVSDPVDKPELQEDPEAEAASKPESEPEPMTAPEVMNVPVPEPAEEAEPLMEAEQEPTPEPVSDAAVEQAAPVADPPSAPLPEPQPAAEPDPTPEPVPESAAILNAAPSLVLAPEPTAEERASEKADEKAAAKLAARQKKLDESSEQSPFSVIVGRVYDGPLDLLLDLIRKQDIDIYDIPIAKITAQFLAYVNQLKATDVDVAGEFIYTASLLIHIKSKMLLPRMPTVGDETAEDPRRELVERLLEHERFKNAAQMLQQKQMLEAATWSNPGVREFKGDAATEPEIAADTVDLVRIFRDILDRARQRPVLNVSEDSVTVGQMIQFLARRLTMEDKPVALRRLLSHTRSERALIAMFLALLELVRLQAILLRQDRQFSEIFIKKHTGFDAVMNEGLANARDDWR